MSHCVGLKAGRPFIPELRSPGFSDIWIFRRNEKFVSIDKICSENLKSLFLEMWIECKSCLDAQGAHDLEAYAVNKA